jgi:hypothetical protein
MLSSAKTRFSKMHAKKFHAVDAITFGVLERFILASLQIANDAQEQNVSSSWRNRRDHYGRDRFGDRFLTRGRDGKRTRSEGKPSSVHDV